MTAEISNVSDLGVSSLELKKLRPSEKSQNRSANTTVDNIIRFESNNRNNVAAQTSKIGSSRKSDAISVNSATRKAQSESDKKQTITQSVNDLNHQLQSVSRKLEFRIDEDSGRTVITVRESGSKDVIRQIPSEQVLEVSRRLKDLESNARFSEENGTSATGILFTSRT